MGENLGGEKQAVGQTLFAEDGDPGIGADQEAGPKRNHYQREEKTARRRRGPTDSIGGGVSHHHADDGGEEGVEDGVAEDRQPGGVETAEIVLQGEVINHPAEEIPLAKTGQDQQAGGQSHKNAEPNQQRGE